jgi:sugar lactone lactonase YvrE
MTTTQLFDKRIHHLGEGPLWHPQRQQLFWFDILAHRLCSQLDGKELSWQFDECVSAAGWIDLNTLLIASETGLYRFDLDTSAQQLVCELESDNPLTRSNDGRADPWGGFWIGTMGKSAEPNAGAIYRYYRGELRKLVAPITISNSICFSPDRRFVYFTDTPSGIIRRQCLDAETGWLTGSPQAFIDLTAEGLAPDGSVVDVDGNLWNAQWGAGRVACYSASGKFVRAIELEARQVTCPAFGGVDLDKLFVTSACEAMDRPGPQDGAIFVVDSATKGQAEFQVIV